MATAGALADFKRLPPQRKALLFGVVGLLVGLLYFQFGYRSLTESIDNAESAHSTKVAQNKTLGDNIPKYDDAKAQLAELTNVIAQNQTALPTEAELPAFFETLNRKVIEAGVQVINYKRAPEEKVESFIKAPVKFEITGTFMQIKRFFASLVQKDVGPAVQTPTTPGDAATEDRERIVSIENLSLGTPVVRERQLYLTAKFTASTFRQEEKKPAPGTGSGSAAGAGSGAGSGAMPMPSAATPQGAKVRAENAIDKADTKDRNATGVDEAKTPTGSGSDRLKGGL
jgi:Tfp pilus assembly protein PilO